MNYEHYMTEALAHAEHALATGEFPVGCVMVGNGNVLATGARAGTAASDSNEIDHAEMIALRQLHRSGVSVDPSDITLFCTLEPCLMCYGALLIAGIHNIVYAYEDAMGGGTRCDLKTLPPLYQDAPVSIVSHVLRKESLALFKAYFDNPANTYLADTFLAAYTRRQPMDSR